MAEHSSQHSLRSRRKRRVSWILVFFIAIAILSISFAGVLFMKNTSLESELNEINQGAALYEKDQPQFNGEHPATPDTVKQPFSIRGVIIADKKHPLPKTYNPGENPEAVAHLKELIAAGQKSGDEYTKNLIENWSGFRSFTEQLGVFDDYLKQGGEKFATDYSANPGYSEHQTGLAFDLRVTGGVLYRGNDHNYDYYNDWVGQNAHRFGFIVRYRDKWQDWTGYKGEPWHLRYLGTDLATKVFEADKPLEQYLSISGGDFATK